MACVNRLHDRAIGGLLVTYHDTSARHAAEEELAHRALHDPLTDLPNRGLLLDRIASALAQRQRGYGHVAVLFCDLDRFKLVNDSLGHEAGDALLVEVAARLKTATRPGDTVARFGGDEFVVVCADVPNSAAAIHVAQRVLGSLATPIALGDRDVTASMSIGIALSGSDDSAERLLRNADAAMYRAKDNGRHRLELYHPDLSVDALVRVDTERELRDAIAKDQLLLHYQPIVLVESGEIVSFEALMRWAHPTRGLLGPNEFIDVLEDTGLIVPAGRWAIQQAAVQLRRWLGQGFPVEVAVNVSPRQLLDGSFVDAVSRALDSTGVPPGSFLLEITESSLVPGQRGIDQLQDLRSLGVRMALDDFGTGYSSLSYLTSFPVDSLKVDRAFIADIEDAGGAIVRAVAAVAAAFGIEVVAEGVETPAQLALVRSIGIRRAQGFLFGRPAPAAHWTAALRARPVATHREPIGLRPVV